MRPNLQRTVDILEILKMNGKEEHEMKQNCRKEQKSWDQANLSNGTKIAFSLFPQTEVRPNCKLQLQV